MNTTIAATENKWSKVAGAVAEMCARVPASAGAAGLCRELARLGPQWNFREVLSRGGWYRPGGIVDATGARISDDLPQWVDDHLRAADDDLQALADAQGGRGLRGTRIEGRTHYLVAATGADAADFVQIEIEELQETIGAELFPGGTAPESAEELTDPPAAERAPLGAPRYALRRITDIGGFLARIRAQKPEPQPVHRFVAAWQDSSAGLATQFSNHWVLAVREHLDRYRQTILAATPVAAVNGLPPRFEGGFGARGLALHETLQRFDRQAGYPMAWFFHMLTTKAVPHAVAAAVVEDMGSGFGYLPERDVRVVKDWLFRPYAF